MIKLILVLLIFVVAGCMRKAAQGSSEMPAVPTVQPPPAETPIEGRSSVGNGNDFFDARHGSAWFLGERLIRYCYVVHPDFRIGHNGIAATIETSFEHWRSYLRKKKINIAKFHPTIGRQDGDPELHLKTQKMAACDGTEDLKFYFGIEDETVRKYLRHYHNPIGISERTAYDDKTGWGKGFIWIAQNDRNGPGVPNWRRPAESFDAIVLHELGHVAGCGHVGNTIMDPDLTHLIRAQEDWDNAGRYTGSLGFRLMSIDGWGLTGKRAHLKELLLCEDCGFDNPMDAVIEEELHFALTGIKLSKDGVAVAVLHKKKHFDKFLDFTFWSGDEKREYTNPKKLRISDLYPIARFEDATPLFKMVFRRKGEKEPTTLVAHSRGVAFAGIIRAVDGAQYPVFFKRNTATENFVVEVRVGPKDPLRLYRLWHVLEWDGEKVL